MEKETQVHSQQGTHNKKIGSMHFIALEVINASSIVSLLILVVLEITHKINNVKLVMSPKFLKLSWCPYDVELCGKKKGTRILIGIASLIFWKSSKSRQYIMIWPLTGVGNVSDIGMSTISLYPCILLTHPKNT